MSDDLLPFYCTLGVKDFYNDNIKQSFVSDLNNIVNLIMVYEKKIANNYYATKSTSVFQEYYKLLVCSRDNNIYIEALPKRKIKKEENHLLMMHNASIMYHMMIKISFVIQITLVSHKVLLSGYMSTYYQSKTRLDSLGIFNKSTGIRVYIEKRLTNNIKLMSAFYKLRGLIYDDSLAISTDFRLGLKCISHLGITLVLIRKSFEHTDVNSFSDATKLFQLNKIFLENAFHYINSKHLDNDEITILADNHNNVISISNGILDKSLEVINFVNTPPSFTPEIGDILLISGSRTISRGIIKIQKLKYKPAKSSHVLLCIGEGVYIDAIPKDGIKMRYYLTAIVNVADWRCIRIKELTSAQKENIQKSAIYFLNQQYNYNVLSVGKDKSFCSEFIGKVFDRASVDIPMVTSITPFPYEFDRLADEHIYCDDITKDTLRFFSHMEHHYKLYDFGFETFISAIYKRKFLNKTRNHLFEELKKIDPQIYTDIIQIYNKFACNTQIKFWDDKSY